MCGQYFLEESPELRPIVEEMNRSPLLPYYPDESAVVRAGEAAPSRVLPVIALNRAGKKTVFPMKWGFSIPKTGTGSRLLINARVETAAQKSAFREAWAVHRCIVPASWYFEWEHDDAGKATKTKYAIRPQGQSLTWLCGLYRLEQGIPVFVILTREPSESVAFLHDRMPFILSEADVDRWIDPNVNPHVLLSSALTDLAFEKESLRKTQAPGREPPTLL